MVESEKKLAALAAVELIEDGMRVGIGTGSTINHFINLLGKRLENGLSIAGVATSKDTTTLCRQARIPLTDLNENYTLDITIDGADEFDPALNLIKGGGGALLYEKIVAEASDRVVIVADSSKQVQKLGAFSLPVEIVAMACRPLIQRIKILGALVDLRVRSDGSPFITQEGNWILDCAFGPAIAAPLELAQELSSMAGVVEHGLFCGLVERVLVGKNDEVLDLAPI